MDSNHFLDALFDYRTVPSYFPLLAYQKIMGAISSGPLPQHHSPWHCQWLCLHYLRLLLYTFTGTYGLAASTSNKAQAWGHLRFLDRDIRNGGEHYTTSRSLQINQQPRLYLD